MEVGDARTTLSCVDAGLNPSLWRPRYKWDARRIRGRDGSEDFLQPSAVRNSRKRLDSNNFFFVASRFFQSASALTWATETVTFASVTQRESNRLHDAPLLYTPRTITTSLHFPRANAREGAGCGRHARRGYLPDLSPRRRTGSGPIAVSRAASVARSDLNRALWTLGTETPRRLAFRARSTRAPGFPLRLDGRAVPRVPRARVSHLPQRRDGVRDSEGHPTARWRRSGSSRPHYRGAVRSARRRRDGGTRPRRWARRPCGACAGTRRARSALAPRAMGWRSRDTPRGRSGSGGPSSARRRPSPRRGARASLARVVRLRRRARRRRSPRDGACGCARARLGHHERCARRGARTSAFENRSPLLPHHPREPRRASFAAERFGGSTSARERRGASRAPVASETILSRSAKRYVSPFQAERAKQATIRALKAKGECRTRAPPVVADPGREEAARKKPTCAPSPTSTRSIRAR